MCARTHVCACVCVRARVCVCVSAYMRALSSYVVGASSKPHSGTLQLPGSILPHLTPPADLYLCPCTRHSPHPHRAPLPTHTRAHHRQHTPTCTTSISSIPSTIIRSTSFTSSGSSAKSCVIPRGGCKREMGNGTERAPLQVSQLDKQRQQRGSRTLQEGVQCAVCSVLCEMGQGTYL